MNYRYRKITGSFHRGRQFESAFMHSTWLENGGVKRALQAEEVAGANTVSLSTVSAAVNPGQRGFWFGKLSPLCTFPKIILFPLRH